MDDMHGFGVGRARGYEEGPLTQALLRQEAAIHLHRLLNGRAAVSEERRRASLKLDLTERRRLRRD